VNKKTADKPQTMAELLAAAKNKVRSFSTGQKVKGKVLAKNSKSLILDVGGKSEGVVAEKAFAEARDLIKTLKVGDEVTATVIVPETKEGVVLLSLRQAAFDASWERLEKAQKDLSPVAVFGKGVNPSGVTVDVEGILGFIPGSQLGKEVAKNPTGLIGKYFKAIVLEVDKLANKVVLSEKAISEAEDIKKAKEIVAKIKEGDIFDGEVTTVANFGCFVRLNLEKKAAPMVEGLVHISELSWGKVAHTSDVVAEGDKLKVKVIGVKDGRLSLSIKQAQKNPWDEAETKYKPETKVKGKVVKVSDFGVFVQLEPGIEGLVHITQIPPGKKLNEGDEINCYVQDLDTKAKKLSLGLVLTSKPIGYK
jgi:small subunit ribosomal protein S1